jgi:hypothetical protein
MADEPKKRLAVDFQGSLKVLAVESVLQILYFTQLSGKLILLNPPGKATLFFTKGRLVWGTLHTQQKQLGQRLLEADAITDEQLNECLKIHMNEKHKARLGEILLKKGFVEMPTLRDSIKAQVKDAFFHVMTWEEGTFAFVSDLSSDEEIVLDERIDHLLFEGVVHNDNEADNSDDSDD